MSVSKSVLTGIAAAGLALSGCFAGLQARADGSGPTPINPGSGCSAVSVNIDGHAVFGANLDFEHLTPGQLFINRRGMVKTGITPGTTGVVAQWVSKYGSLTFNFVGYQYAWGGMNERGLVMSTMAFPQSIYPPPDHRPVVDSGFWIQYLLDTCATVGDVIASDALVRNVTVDHYLISDRNGDSAVIEYLDGEMVVRTGGSLPVSVLANWYYADSLHWWRALRDSGNYSAMDGSIQRFCLAADRVSEFDETNGAAAIRYVFDTLEIIKGENFSQHASQWSIVFDTKTSKVFFKTLAHPEIKWLDLAKVDLRCSRGVQMMEIQSPVIGDVGALFYDYSHLDARDQYYWFIDTYHHSLTHQWADQMLQHFEGFSCQPPSGPRRVTGRHEATARGP